MNTLAGYIGQLEDERNALAQEMDWLDVSFPTPQQQDRYEECERRVLAIEAELRAISPDWETEGKGVLR
jgi:hypothetical protein